MYFHRRWQLILLGSFLAMACGHGSMARGDIVSVLFTGFNPSNPSGMDFFKDSLDSNFSADFPAFNHTSQVFRYSERSEAFDFINSQSQIDHLFIAGHSWGGNATIRLATEWLLQANINVDASFQFDSVDIFDGGLGDDVLPSNVTNGYNFYQIPTGFFEPGGERNVSGALNVNAEDFFNDSSITHTSIDDDTRLFDLFYSRMRTIVVSQSSVVNPQSVPEPHVLFPLAIGLVYWRTRRQRT
ncbi:MAG: hypothetical protein P8J33_18040 [Pirellulaceae bacterium]|nr:hypothetical protein [Pirellulaceae bacterium]